MNLNYDLQKISNFAGIVIIIMMAVIAPFFGGYDYKVAYRADTLAGVFGNKTFFPYPASWFIYPFAVLPETLGYLIWNLVNALGFILAIRHWRGNYLAFSLFIGTFWTFYSGQVEGFLAGAIVLAMLPNPWLAGIGILILSFKPQVGLLPILFILIKRKDWRLLAIPTVVYLASFIRWGWWVPAWLAALQPLKDNSVVATNKVSFYPYALILLPLLWRYREKLNIWMYIQSMIIPYFPVYSLTPLFTVAPPPMWFNIAIWLFYLLAFKYLALSKLGFILLFSLFLFEVWKIEKGKHLITAKEQANDRISG